MTVTPCLHSTCSVDAIMSCKHCLALERLGVVGCLYNTSILSRRPIEAIIPPPNPTHSLRLPCHPSYWFLWPQKCSFFSSVDSTVQGRCPQGCRPQGLAAVKWNPSNQMTFSTTYLRSLILRRDLVETILSFIQNIPHRMGPKVARNFEDHGLMLGKIIYTQQASQTTFILTSAR